MVARKVDHQLCEILTEFKKYFAMNVKFSITYDNDDADDDDDDDDDNDNDYTLTYFSISDNEPSCWIFVFQFQKISQQRRSVPRHSIRLKCQETLFILGSMQLQI